MVIKCFYWNLETFIQIIMVVLVRSGENPCLEEVPYKSLKWKREVAKHVLLKNIICLKVKSTAADALTLVTQEYLVMKSLLLISQFDGLV